MPCRRVLQPREARLDLLLRDSGARVLSETALDESRTFARGRTRAGYARRVKQLVEREVKLSPDDGFVLPELGGEALPTRRFVSTYHDTADLALAHRGVTLRYRVEAGSGLWQLKLPKGAARIELEQPGTPARPPLELASLLLGHLRGRPIGPVARLRTRREVVRADGAEIVDDAVAVLAGPRVVGRFRELEVELVDGDERGLKRLEKALRKAGATTGEQRPKLLRALDLVVPSSQPTIGRKTAPTVALGAALAEQARRLLLHDPGTRLGSDVEDLHQMRVATRRLRAFLRVGRPLLDESWSEPLRDELAWLGGALGPARDLDVLLEHLGCELHALDEHEVASGLLETLRAEQTEARRAVVATLSSDRYLALLERLDHVGTPELTGDETPLAELWASAWTRARKRNAALGRGAGDEQLHEARIALKRARYAAELAGHELGKRGRRFEKAAAALQDVLGTNQDAAVAEERVRAWAVTAEEGVVAGQLVQRQHDRKAAAAATRPVAWKAVRRAAKKLG